MINQKELQEKMEKLAKMSAQLFDTFNPDDLKNQFKNSLISDFDYKSLLDELNKIKDNDFRVKEFTNENGSEYHFPVPGFSKKEISVKLKDKKIIINAKNDMYSKLSYIHTLNADNKIDSVKLTNGMLIVYLKTESNEINIDIDN